MCSANTLIMRTRPSAGTSTLMGLTRICELSRCRSRKSDLEAASARKFASPSRCCVLRTALRSW